MVCIKELIAVSWQPGPRWNSVPFKLTGKCTQCHNWYELIFKNDLKNTAMYIASQERKRYFLSALKWLLRDFVDNFTVAKETL